MKRVLFISIFIIFSFSNVFAEGGFLGKRYVNLLFSQTTPGDEELRAIDDSILGFTAGFNLPIHSNIDFTISFEQLRLDGQIPEDIQRGMPVINVEGTSRSLNGKITYHFTPNQPINPFLTISKGIIRTEYKFSIGNESVSEDIETSYISFGGGVEFQLSEETILRPFFQYSKTDDNDSTGINIALAHWFNANFFGILAASYLPDEGDNRLTVGGGIEF